MTCYTVTPAPERPMGNYYGVEESLRNQFIMWLRTVTYKPTAVLGTGSEDSPNTLTLVASTYVLDAYGSAQMVPVVARNNIHIDYLGDENWRLDEARALAFVRQTLNLLESHEVDEWLRIDGKHATDPHPELGTQ